MSQLPSKVTVRWLLKALEEKSLESDICQRPPNQWNSQQKRALIQTLLRKEEHISPIILCKYKNESITYLDGQQRINTIKDFVENDSFYLNKETVEYLISSGFKVKRSRQTYEDLPKELKDRILNFSFPVEWMDQKQEETDDSFLERRVYRFNSVNNGTKVSANDKKQASALLQDKYHVFQDLRLFQNLIPEGEVASSLTWTYPTFFTRASKGNDKFAWSYLYMLVWIISRISKGDLPLLKSRSSLLNKEKTSWEIPPIPSWINVIKTYTKDMSKENYTCFKNDLDMAISFLQSKGESFKRVSYVTYDQKKISWDNLILCFSVIFKIPNYKFPDYLNKEELSNITSEYSRKAGADVILLCSQLSSCLTTLFPLPELC